MNKKVTTQQMQEAIKLNRKYGMMLPVSFIIGMPGENEQTCQETVDFCIKNKLPLKSIMFATPYPGTKIFDFAIDRRRIKKDKVHEFVLSLEDARDFTVNLTDSFTDEELVSKRESMIRGVCSKIKGLSEEVYTKKIKDLFGELGKEYFKDESLLKHRAEHGGIDIF